MQTAPFEVSTVMLLVRVLVSTSATLGNERPSEKPGGRLE